MIRHLLCPVDCSKADEHAVRQAAVTAASMNARLTLLHVAQPISIPLPDTAPAPIGPLRDEDRRRIHGWLDGYQQIAEQLRVATSVDIVVGRPSDEIVAWAAAGAVDLIVMATHGYSGLKHLLLGSVTERVLRTAPCPVMTVPPHAEAIRTGPFKRVLCPVDFSDCSLRALEFAMTASLASGADLLLAHVLEWPWHEPPAPKLEDLPHDEAAALAKYRERREEEALRRLIGLQPEGWQDRCQTWILNGVPHVELLQLAADRHVDAIVLGAAGHNAIDLAVFGSTTNHIVRRASCPVITVTE